MNNALTQLRRAMAASGVDAYVVPTDDFHGSEYVGDYFKCREYISGFTGSAGTLAVTETWAGLWTDGRYFLQAEAELAGSGIELMKMGEPGTPELRDLLASRLSPGQVLGFDGRTMTLTAGRRLEKAMEKAGVSLRQDLDLAGEIWTDRPPLPAGSGGTAAGTRPRRPAGGRGWSEAASAHPLTPASPGRGGSAPA